MSMRIDSCRPFWFLTDSPSLTLADIQTEFPTATKILYVLTNNASTHGTAYYLVWAGYEITIPMLPVFGTNLLPAAFDAYDNGFRGLPKGIVGYPTDRIRVICDYTPPANAKGVNTEDFSELEKI